MPKLKPMLDATAAKLAADDKAKADAEAAAAKLAADTKAKAMLRLNKIKLKLPLPRNWLLKHLPKPKLMRCQKMSMENQWII